MKLVSDIAKRFNSSRHLPRSLAVMRAVSIAGIAIGTATLIVALSIVAGFQREYRRSVLDFNAHVVVLEANEMKDVAPVVGFASALRQTKDEKKFFGRTAFMMPAVKAMTAIYQSMKNFHDDISLRLEERPEFYEVWEKIQPERFKVFVPDILLRLKTTSEKGVIGMTPFLYREGLAISKGIIKGIVVKGVDPKTVREVNRMRLNLAGDISIDDALAPSKYLNVILGKALFERLGSPEKITLMVPQTAKDKQFVTATVAGTFESGLYDYDSQFALMNIEVARTVFETGGIVATGVEIKLDDPEKAQAIAYALNNALPSVYQAITWDELNRDLFEALSLEKLVFSIIMGILVVVAAFNIIGVLVLLICYRAHEVAILKALGIRTDLLRKIFTRSGVSTGLAGTAIGIGLGLGISWAVKHFHLIRLEPEIYFLSALPLDISWPICGKIALFSLLMCYVTSRIAARRLAGLPISEAL